MQAEGEKRELEELTEMIATGGSPSLRDSPVTASRYNRWLVGEQNRVAGQHVARGVENLRKAKEEFHERHRQYGGSLKQEGQEQLRRDKEVRELNARHNLMKGQQVKFEVQSQKAQEERQKQEWKAHGRSLAVRAMKQKQRIKDVVGENSKRVAEKTAKAKQEELDYERELVGVRQKLIDDNRAEVEKVRAETADEVIDAAKEFMFEQKKSLAFSTKAAEEAWRDERAAHTKAHLAKAHANKADAAASRAKAKVRP